MHLSQKTEMCVCSWLWAPTDLQHEGIFFKTFIVLGEKKKGLNIVSKPHCQNLLKISEAVFSRGSVMSALSQLQQNSNTKPFSIVKKGKISDDHGQWNIGWWCLMTNDWASGFCAGVTTVIYSCRSHQSEHFQCSPSSSQFNELGLCFNFPFPPARHFAEKVHPSSSIYQCYSPT